MQYVWIQSNLELRVVFVDGEHIVSDSALEVLPNPNHSSLVLHCRLGHVLSSGSSNICQVRSSHLDELKPPTSLAVPS